MSEFVVSDAKIINVLLSPSLEDSFKKCIIECKSNFSKLKVTSITEKIFSEEGSAIANSLLSLARSVAYIYHEVRQNFSQTAIMYLELTKTIVLISLPLSLANIVNDLKEHFAPTDSKEADEDISCKKTVINTALGVTTHLSSIAESVGMLGEAALAAGKTGRLVNAAPLLGTLSTVAGTLVWLFIDIKGLHRLTQCEKALDQLKGKDFHKVFQDRVKSMKMNHYMNMTVTTVCFVAYGIFTYGRPRIAVYGWGLMATAMSVSLLSRYYVAKTQEKFNAHFCEPATSDRRLS